MVLTGLLKEGTLGPIAIKEAGGVALVQSPEEATFAEMPRNAIKYNGLSDFVGRIHEFANLSARWPCDG